MKNISLLSAAVISLIFLTPTTKAQEANYLSLGIGYYDILDNERTGDVRIEYRVGTPLFFDKLKPWAGAEITSDTSVWGGVGLLADFNMTYNIILTPSFGAGLYTKGGSNLDLGHTLEFRSQLELGYKLDTGNRLGAAFSHISNAGLSSKNPGTEVLNIYYHMPVDKLFQ